MNIKKSIKKSHIISFIVLLLLITWIIFSSKFSGTEKNHEKMSILQRVNGYVELYGLYVDTIDLSSNMILINFTIGGDRVKMLIDILEADSLIIVRCPFPGRLIRNKMPEIALMLMQLNSESFKGNFEIDTTQRLLYYRKTIDPAMIQMNDSTFLFELADAVYVMENAIPLILKASGITIADSTNNTFPDMS